MTYARMSRAAAVSAALLSLLCVGGHAHAQWKPTKTVEMIVHTGPGWRQRSAGARNGNDDGEGKAAAGSNAGAE